MSNGSDPNHGPFSGEADAERPDRRQGRRRRIFRRLGADEEGEGVCIPSARFLIGPFRFRSYSHLSTLRRLHTQ